MENLKIIDIIKNNPETINFFRNQGIDYNKFSNHKLLDIIKELNLPKNYIINELNYFINSDQNIHRIPDNIEILDMSELIEHILKKHHIYERKLVNDIRFKISELLTDDLIDNNKIVEISELFINISKEIFVHFTEEEISIFPEINKSVRNDDYNEYVIEIIEKSEETHSIIGAYVKELIKITDEFSPDPDMPEIYNLMMMEMDEFVKDLFLHIYIENLFLFERYEKIYEELKL